MWPQEFGTKLLHLPDACIGGIAADGFVAQADGFAHTASFASTAHPLRLAQIDFGTQGAVGVASHQVVEGLQISSLILRGTSILPLPIVECGQQAGIRSVGAGGICLHGLPIKAFDACIDQ